MFLHVYVCVMGEFIVFCDFLHFSFSLKDVTINSLPYFMFKSWALSAWSLLPSLQQAPISEYVGISDSGTSKNAASGMCSLTTYNFSVVISV